MKTCVDGEPSQLAEADQYSSDDVDDSSMSNVSSDMHVSDTLSILSDCSDAEAELVPSLVHGALPFENAFFPSLPIARVEFYDVSKTQSNICVSG